jgi:hypothetical protein
VLNLLSRLLPRIPDNRIVAFVMPIVTPPVAFVAGIAATWLTEHVPGVHVTRGEATAFGLTVSGSIVIHAIDGARQWFKGHLSRVSGGAGGVVDVEAEELAPADLPSDEEELGDDAGGEDVGEDVGDVVVTEDTSNSEDSAREGPPVQPSQAGLEKPRTRSRTKEAGAR